MKFNKWTLGLAAVGVVSLALTVRADEKTSTVNTALSTTTPSSYADGATQHTNATRLNVVDIVIDYNCAVTDLLCQKNREKRIDCSSQQDGKAKLDEIARAV